MFGKTGGPIGHVAHRVSSGLLTTIRMQDGDWATALRVQSPTILEFVLRRSSRLMPGFRAIPAVMTTMSEFAVSL